MKNILCIFEDEGFKNFLPLTYLRPVYDLRCGILTLREKISLRFPSKSLVLHSRSYLNSVLRERYPKFAVNEFDPSEILFVNGSIILTKENAKQIAKLELNKVLVTNDGSVAAARLSPDKLKNLKNSDSGFLQFDSLSDVKRVNTNINLLNYPWDLVNLNGEEIKNDFALLVKRSSDSNLKKLRAVEFKNKKNIFISSGAVIDPFVFMDASNGPIYIGKNAYVMSHTVIQGPAFIGNDTLVKSHAAIYHNTSIGEVCKVGGEVESSIIHSYSNKQHEGFLGHSYLGSWVNLGASTNNSDLKNNYSNVSVLLNGKPIDTNSQFVGLIMGDHSKTAINTMFNTGTVIGVSCNVFGAGFPSRYLPSFSWGGSDLLQTYDINKSIEAAKVVTARRGIAMSENEINLLKYIFELTAAERK
ncbi:MAG: GlmU family protein [Bacteroidetes bacterium]|nr:GlmU family protein [Bacteroidota bacterium]